MQMEHKKRFAGLDGVRAIFCIGIVIYHVNEPLRWGGGKMAGSGVQIWRILWKQHVFYAEWIAYRIPL